RRVLFRSSSSGTLIVLPLSEISYGTFLLSNSSFICPVSLIDKFEYKGKYFVLEVKIDIKIIADKSKTVTPMKIDFIILELLFHYHVICFLNCSHFSFI